MIKPTIASQFPEMISLEEMQMSLLLMGWKFEDQTVSGDNTTSVMVWRSHKDDIIQVRFYEHQPKEISYFKNWGPQNGPVGNIEKRGNPELLIMHTYKEALILAELRT